MQLLVIAGKIGVEFILPLSCMVDAVWQGYVGLATGLENQPLLSLCRFDIQN